MKLPNFEYHRPGTTEEALALLAEVGDDAKVLAGGQSLIPLLALRLSQPAHLVDIGALADGAGISEEAGSLRLGTRARQADVEGSPVVRRLAPMLSAAAPLVGHRAIRNRGTICGSVAHADPAAEMPAVMRALDAEMVVRNAAGERVIAAADFFDGYLSSAVAEDELLVEIRIPPWPAGAGCAVDEVCRRHGDFALIGAATVVELGGDGRIARAAISLFGAASTPVRVTDAETMVVGEAPSPELIEAAGQRVADAIDPPADNHATTAHRKHLAKVLTRRCLTAAVADARGAA